MPYRRGTYDFVVDNSFTPFSMQEMLVPLTAYKEAFEKDEAAYQDLTDRADVFKDLSESLPEGSEARKIYEGYANDLKAQAEDFSQNGLSMSNRSALRRLKRRYQGEIGMLDKANKALEAEKALRRQMVAKDPSMLYAVAPEDLNIDQFIGGKTPSLYGISGTDLYTKAAAASQAMSKRQFSVNGESKTLGGYYYDYIQRMGYTPEQLRQFGDQISADFAAQVSVLPELQQAANQILEANGVNENLTGNSLRKAQQQVIRGLIDGAVYSEQHNPQRDLGVMTATEKAADARAMRGYELSKQELAMKKQEWLDNRALKYNFLKDEKGNPILDENGLPKIDPNNPINPTYIATPRKGKSSDGTSKEEGGKTKADALLQLGYSQLSNDAGFEVVADGTRHHYDYIGGLSKHGGKWRHGAMGKDAPGTGWGFLSTANNEGWWGNYTAESIDDGNSITNWIWPQKVKERVRVLSDNEIASKFGKDAGLQEAFTERVNEYLKEHNIDPKSQQAQSLDIQIVAIPNEIGGRGEEGYLIAIN